MIPNLEFLGKTITPYMLLALTGVLVILFLAQWLGKRHGLDDIHILFMLLYCFIGILVGGHLLYGITNMELIVHTLQNLQELDSLPAVLERLALIFGGSVYYGGLLGALAVAFLYLRHCKLPVGPYSDAVSVVIPLFHFFGRLGCFLSGCCYGIPWEHGFVYRCSLVESANGIPRFPVQLVEACVNLLLFLAMYSCLKKGKCKDRLLMLYLTVYPICRFVLEFFRGDAYRGFLGPLSTSQIISVIILICVCAAHLWSKRKKAAT